MELKTKQPDEAPATLVVEVTTDEAIGSTNAGTAIYIVDATGLASKSSSSATLLGYARAAVGSTDLSFEVVCA